MSMVLTALRRSGRVQILDGGMGVLLPKLGVPKDPILWSARALIEEKYHPIVVQAHRAYIDAGATAIITSNYGVIPGYMRKANLNLEAEAPRLAALVGQLAREAAGPKGGGVLVLGSLPPLIDSYRADLLMPDAEAVSWYAMLARAMAPYVDLFVCETMSCPAEAASALKGLKEGDPDGKAWVCFAVDSEGKCRDGTPFNVAVRQLSTFSHVSGVGVNCCIPEAVELAVATLDTDPQASAFASSVERVVYANSYPKEHNEGVKFSTETLDDEDVREDLTAEHYAESAKKWANRSTLPFTFIGGCCGILPHHIKLVAASLKPE